MCFPAALAGLGLGGGAATAAGATAAAATAGTAVAATAGTGLATAGLIASVGGALLQGVMGMQAANAQADALADQKQTEAQLAATQDQRRRGEMNTAIRQQFAELASRGVTLDSPTVIALGQSAAQELSFDSQAIRSGGSARQMELSAEQKRARAGGISSLLSGVASAAGSLLTAAPDVWPGFARQSGNRVLQ